MKLKLCDECYPLRVKHVGKDEWLKLVIKFSDYNYRQSWDFGMACAERLNALSEHIVITADDEHEEIIGIADVRVKKIPFIGGGIAYISGGPLLAKSGSLSRQIYSQIVSELIKEYSLKRKLTLRIAPPPQSDKKSKTIETALADLSFKKIQKKKKTILLDLAPDLDTLRGGLHQKWRNCLNKSEKSNIKLKSGKSTSLFSEFSLLFDELVVKKNFSVDLDVDFYTHVQKKAVDSDQYILTIAEINGTPVAGHLSSILGDTCVYLLGASNDIGRKANAAYLLQWHTITQAKSRGCRWYDLGGIDSEGNSGVYLFKQRMGGDEVIIPGPFEFKTSGIRAVIPFLGEFFYTYFKPYLTQYIANVK
jgi:hypothetical protein